MHLNNLANELILHIFHSCASIRDAHSLALTNRHFHSLFSGSQKLPILLSAVETQYGPLHDAIQIVTQNSSQPAHLPRSVPISLALFKQILTLGRAAEAYTALYPRVKWKDDYASRRLLSGAESFLLRRAIYRLWLYTSAFHNARFARTTRTLRATVLERAALLHNFPTPELAQMLDAHNLLRDVVRSHICPSNGAIQRRFRKRHPDAEVQLHFNIHLNYPPPPTSFGFQQYFHSAHQATAANSASMHNLKFRYGEGHEPGAEGWGDDIPHYYVVEDMLKLDPGQILWLRDNAPLKGMVEGYVKGLGEWFENNGETFGQTLEWVLGERGEDVEEVREAVLEREMGIVVD